MKLYSWNVNGIRAVIKKELFTPFLQEHQPDILCLQEVKASSSQVEMEAPDYQVFWNSAHKSGYSGTAILTRQQPLTILNNLPEQVVSDYDLDHDGYGHPNQEGRVLALELPEFWLVNVYTPNSKNDLSRLELRHKYWDPAFLSYLQQLQAGQHGQQVAKPVVFCGDLNVAHQEIDLARPNENRGKHGFTDEERQGFDRFLQAGFIDSFRHLHPDAVDAYSWWTHWANARARNVGWRIDYFLVSSTLTSQLQKAQIHPQVMGSDHCPVSIELA